MEVALQVDLLRPHLRLIARSRVSFCRHGIGEKRPTGARLMLGGEWGGLFFLRDLQRDVITGTGNG